MLDRLGLTSDTHTVQEPYMKILKLEEAGIHLAYVDIPGSALGSATGSATAATPRVFLHGLGSSSIAIFPEIAADPRLAGPRSILIDLPGFGYSSASDQWAFTIEYQARIVAEVLARLEIRSCDLIGHSMGASVAISLAHRRPDLVQRLVVAEPNLDPGHGTLSAHIAARSERDFLTVGHAMLVRGTQQQARRGEPNAVTFLATLLQAQTVALHRAAVSLLAERTPTFRQQLLGITIPRTYVAGARSGGPPQQDLTGDGIAHVQIPNAGHVMMEDDPDAFITAIAAATLIRTH
jgi:pimeloyl-ACP methyl ester carboxylesterase